MPWMFWCPNCKKFFSTANNLCERQIIPLTLDAEGETIEGTPEPCKFGPLCIQCGLPVEKEYVE